MNYLTEHNLIDYASLKEKAATVTIQYNDLAEQIKLAEKRMAEIAVLKKHIINYAKTREIYVAYRKSGYSKKFMSEHESEILLHKAAKQAFDNLGMDKLPTISSLQDEYAQLMEEKKKIYPKFLSVRNQQRELLKVKHNIDVMMRITEKAEEAKEHDSKDHQHWLTWNTRFFYSEMEWQAKSKIKHFVYAKGKAWTWLLSITYIKTNWNTLQTIGFIK